MTAIFHAFEVALRQCASARRHRPGKACAAPYRLLGKLNTAPSRTPALGQRWVMVLRLV